MLVYELVRKQGLRKGLSTNTIKTYNLCIKKFFRTYGKHPNEVSKNDIESFLHRMIARGAGGNTVNVYVNALRFFYEQVLHKRLTVNVKYMKIRKRLPEFLTQEEVVRFFDNVGNSKHKLMLTFLYSAGLRVSELVKLRVKDLELAQNHGWVRQGKGGKDRPFIIAEKLNEELQEWIEKNKLSYQSWLFTGNSGSHYSVASIQCIVKRVKKKANISKHVTPHTLRHSFATHLIENGYAVTDVQSLLGHSSLETTMIYTHLASPKLLNVRSPLDDLKL